MSRKPAKASAKASRTAKVRALAKRAGTPGEQAAAEAALVRLAPARPASAGIDLTDPVVRQLQRPAKGNKITYDGTPGAPAGFGVRVTAAGNKSFVLNYRVRGTGQERRHTIGEFGSWSTSAARAEAKRLRADIDNGGDPRGKVEEQREAPTMAELCDRFEKNFLPRKRAATQDAYSRLIRLYIRPHFGKFARVDAVRFTDIDKLHSKVTEMGSVYSANRCVAVCSKLFSFAIQLEWRTTNTNPAKGVERNPEVKRKRYLSGDELKRLTAALAEHEDKQFATIIGLLLLTGARRGEVLSMRWADLTLAQDKGIWTKLGSTTKQKTDHVVPLSAPACQLLAKIKTRGEYVFPSDGKTGHVQEIKKSWASLCKNAGITKLRVHDLRHSFASVLVSSGASLALVGSLLGHSSPVTTGRYSHLYKDVEREAVEKIGVLVGNANGDRHD
jgi:integrase